MYALAKRFGDSIVQMHDAILCRMPVTPMKLMNDFLTFGIYISHVEHSNDIKKGKKLIYAV